MSSLIVANKYRFPTPPSFTQYCFQPGHSLDSRLLRKKGRGGHSHPDPTSATAICSLPTLCSQSHPLFLRSVFFLPSGLLQLGSLPLFLPAVPVFCFLPTLCSCVLFLPTLCSHRLFPPSGLLQLCDLSPCSYRLFCSLLCPTPPPFVPVLFFQFSLPTAKKAVGIR
jgi:hypothetical protein